MTDSRFDRLYLGDDLRTNNDVYLDVFHILFTGQTNLSGKTTTIKAVIPEALEKGYTVLVFDTKETGREWDGYHDIPLVYKPTTDPLVLIGLLEGIFHRKVTQYYSTLSRVTERAKDLDGVIKNAEKLEEDSHSGFIKDACHTIVDLAKRLQQELMHLQLSTKLELKEEVLNVMAINELSPEAQQLVIKTAFEELLRRHNKYVIVIIDEAYKFLPQDYSSACKRAVQDVITQGARTKLFVWLATQFIKTTAKDAMKACAVKMLGKQDDPTEIEGTQERAPGGKAKWKSDLIMGLQPGQFIYVSLSEPPRLVYVVPVDKREYHVHGKELAKTIKTLVQPEEDWSEFVPRLEKLEALVK